MITISEALRAFLQDNPVGVLGTRRADGTVRQSVVYAVAMFYDRLRGKRRRLVMVDSAHILPYK